MMDNIQNKFSTSSGVGWLTQMEDWIASFDRLTFKYWCAVLACVLSFTSVIMVAAWAHGSDISAGYLGGLDYERLIFNYHPILMVLGLIFFASLALLSFRVSPFSPSFTSKLTVLLHCSALVCISTGIHYVRMSHTPEHNTEGIFKANLVSLHSWIGLIAVVLYLLNFAGSLLVFVLGLGTDLFTNFFTMTHRNLALAALVTACMAALTGAQMIGASTCSRVMTSEDVNPAAEYGELSVGCRLSNGLGMCVFFSVILAVYVVVPSLGSGDHDITSVVKYAPEAVAEAAANNSLEAGGSRGADRSKPGGRGSALPPHMMPGQDDQLLTR